MGSPYIYNLKLSVRIVFKMLRVLKKSDTLYIIEVFVYFVNRF